MEEMSTSEDNVLLAPPMLSGDLPLIRVHTIDHPVGHKMGEQGPDLVSTPINPNNSMEKGEVGRNNMLLSAMNGSQNANKHVSMRYNMEISANLPLISRSQSMGGKDIGLESLEKEDLQGKVLGLLEKVLENGTFLNKMTKSFRKMDKSLKLSIKRSRQSIASSNSQPQSIGSGEECEKKVEIKPKPNRFPSMTTSIKSSKQNESLSLTTLERVKSMSKSNRISLCDAMNVKIKDVLNEIEPIQSTESIETNSMVNLKSRNDLTSEPEEFKSDEELPTLTLENKPHAKKISIMMDQFQIPSGSSLFSEDEGISLTQLNLPETILSADMIKNYFQTSSPFLTNLALCFFFKMLSKEIIILSPKNLGWLLCISTVVAYKVYYDQTIQCLMQFFSEQLNLSLEEMGKLQRWFLSGINYELVISSEQYQNMMIELLSIPSPKKQQ